MNRAQLKAQAKTLLKPQFITVLLAIIISGFVVGALESMPVVSVTRAIQNSGATTFTISATGSPVTTFGTLVGLLIGGPLAVGAMLVYTAVTAGKTAKLEQLFEPFKTQFVTSFLANLVSGLVIALFSLLLIIPGIMKAYSYAMVPYVLAKEPNLSCMEALHRSQDLMKGHRMELFVLHLSFIGWGLLCVITLGLAAIWVAPYTQITTTLFFDRVYAAEN